MARITVEDCILKVPNRFELVMLAAQRARDISAGAALTLDRDNDKNPVVALREIAEDSVDLDHLRYELIHGLRRHLEVEDRPDESLTLASPLGAEAGDVMLAPESDAPGEMDEPVPEALDVAAEGAPDSDEMTEEDPEFDETAEEAAEFDETAEEAAEFDEAVEEAAELDEAAEEAAELDEAAADKE